MGLTEYQRKRDFRKTPEPRGKQGDATAPRADALSCRSTTRRTSITTSAWN